MNLKGSTANSNAVDEEGVRALWFTGFDMKGDLHWQPLCPRHIWNKNPATLKSYPLDQSLQATSKCAGMIYWNKRSQVASDRVILGPSSSAWSVISQCVSQVTQPTLSSLPPNSNPCFFFEMLMFDSIPVDMCKRVPNPESTADNPLTPIKVDCEQASCNLSTKYQPAAPAKTTGATNNSNDTTPSKPAK
ncbi:hypothetical protein BDP27DRAFT_1450520 [Rhodocollybia butyracea]|uniref:Uncharacterized protein n=1 Tax=Rhodocollybia butyracea TaxID=206335 RepID=A0A9P5PFX1_9AGAR|nr:hypothetical protein BDP27DRAFT_1450520 [Rhodocollybia butyracea]